jgi:hypothetical protein
MLTKDLSGVPGSATWSRFPLLLQVRLSLDTRRNAEERQRITHTKAKAKVSLTECSDGNESRLTFCQT